MACLLVHVMGLLHAVLAGYNGIEQSLDSKAMSAFLEQLCTLTIVWPIGLSNLA